MYNDTDVYSNNEIIISNVIYYDSIFELNITLQYDYNIMGDGWCPSVKISSDMANIDFVYLTMPNVMSQMLYENGKYIDVRSYYLDKIVRGTYSVVIDNCEHLMDGKSILTTIYVNDSTTLDQEVAIFLILVIIVIGLPLIGCLIHLFCRKRVKPVETTKCSPPKCSPPEDTSFNNDYEMSSFSGYPNYSASNI